MTRPVRLEIRGFRGWREGSLPLDRPVTLVVGENRSGKSSTLNAIEWCLFGRVVERKASGIDERADWEVERRASKHDSKGDAGNGEDVEVALVVETDGGVARLVRKRKRGAGARDEDEFVVELHEGSGGQRLVEAEAHVWMDAHRFPDWETWRRACCQHQEILRSRLTVADDRSLIVSSLLGMEEHDRLARLLKDQQPGKLVGDLDRVLEDLDNVVLVRLKTPSEDLFESERKLGALGLERSRLSPALALEVGRGAIDRARGLAVKLGLPAEFPSAGTEADEPEVRKWAEGWPAFVRKESKSGERLASAQKKRARLAAELEQLEPSEERWRKAKEALETSLRDQGDEATQKKLLAEAEAKVAGADAALRAENKTLALLRETLEVLRDSESSDQCPVCDTPVTGLAARLEATVRKGTGERLAALTTEREQARKRRDALEASIRAAQKLAAEEKEARKACDARRSSVTGLVSQGRLDGCADLAAAARAEEEALAAEISGLETSVASLDAELEEHRRDVDRLKELARWGAAAKRAQKRADLTALPEWKALQEAVDAAAAFAADLDALGAMAREAQEERSRAREAEVNRSLGEYAGLITGSNGPPGSESGLEVRVKVKRTPKGLSYDVEDADGERALSILNQASLNAISLAMLFAQAEERARNGLFSMVVLDDPEQSLDEEHQAGLAKAIERVARSSPVVAAATPGTFAERVMSHVALPRRRIRLASSASRGGARAAVRIESQEER